MGDEENYGHTITVSLDVILGFLEYFLMILIVKVNIQFIDIFSQKDIFILWILSTECIA